MSKIKTITENFGSNFVNAVQKLLDEGYELKNANCGVLNYSDGSSDTVYQAILLKEE